MLASTQTPLATKKFLLLFTYYNINYSITQNIYWTLYIGDILKTDPQKDASINANSPS